MLHTYLVQLDAALFRSCAKRFLQFERRIGSHAATILQSMLAKQGNTNNKNTYAGKTDAVVNLPTHTRNDKSRRKCSMPNVASLFPRARFQSMLFIVGTSVHARQRCTKRCRARLLGCPSKRQHHRCVHTSRPLSLSHTCLPRRLRSWQVDLPA